MDIYIPTEYVEPDPISGELPVSTWNARVYYWASFGYFMDIGRNPTTDIRSPVLRFGDIRDRRNEPVVKERNGYIPLVWAAELCDPDITPESLKGEIIGWETVWRVNSSVYPTQMSGLISNTEYAPGQFRNWNQWGSPNHTHYYEALTDKYWIPSWSWGQTIPATEMFIGADIAGINVVARDDFNGLLNGGSLTPQPIEPTP